MRLRVVALIVLGFATVAAGVALVNWKAGVVTAGVLISVLGLLLVEVKD